MTLTRQIKRKEARDLNRIQNNSNSQISTFPQTEAQPYTEDYAIIVAKYLLSLGRHLHFVKQITGFNTQKLLDLELVEWYYPFQTKDKKPDLAIKWLRGKSNASN